MSATMDVGVQGLQEKGELQVRGRDFAKKSENFGEFISKTRKNCLDVQAIPKKLVQQMFIGYIVTKFFKRGLKSIINNDRLSSIITWFLTISFLGYHLAAPKKINSHLKNTVPSYPILGSILSLAKNQKDIHGFFFRELKRGGFQSTEVVLPGSHILMVMDEKDREYILRSNYTNYLKNIPNTINSFEMAMAELFGRGIFAVDQAEWQDHRKIASHLFSSNALKQKMENVFNEHGDKIVNIFKNFSKEKKVFDVQKIFQAVVFDAFCEIAFGVSPKATEEYVEKGQELPFLTSFDFLQMTVVERFFQVPIAWQILRFLGLASEGKLLNHAQVVDTYIRKIVQDRKKNIDIDSHAGDLLSLYIEHARKHPQDSDYMLEDDYLLDMIKNYMVAGRDTTACLMTNLLKFIATNELALNELKNEIKLNASPDDGFISYDIARAQMPFASACINEALRMLPPVCEDMRICQSDEVLPSGIKVKRGMQLWINNLAIGRDPRLWKSPDSFLPNRWLEFRDQVGSIKRPDEYMLPAFWGGPRVCLGVNMARFEAITFLSKIYGNFKVTPQSNQNESLVTGPVGFYRDGFFIQVQLANGIL